MNPNNVTFELQMADKTRRARITMPRSKTVRDIVKASRKQWSLRMGIDFQVANLSRGRQLLPNESLSMENIRDGDVLMLQPLATHGLD